MYVDVRQLRAWDLKAASVLIKVVVSMEKVVKQRKKAYLATRAVTFISIPKFTHSLESVSDRLYSLPVYP